MTLPQHVEKPVTLSQTVPKADFRVEVYQIALHPTALLCKGSRGRSRTRGFIDTLRRRLFSALFFRNRNVLLNIIDKEGEGQ